MNRDIDEGNFASTAAITADGTVTRSTTGTERFHRTRVALRLVVWLLVAAAGIASVVDRQFRTIQFGQLPAWIGLIFAILLSVAPVLLLMLALINPHLVLGMNPAEIAEREARETAQIGRLTNGLTALAALVAGRRRAHVREAWQSDLERPRECICGNELTGISKRRKVAYAAGLVIAALRYRIDDAAVIWWQLADGVLASRFWSRLVLVTPTAIATATVTVHSGLYGLVTNTENLIAIATASAGLVYGGRKVRKITLKPARDKQGQA